VAAIVEARRADALRLRRPPARYTMRTLARAPLAANRMGAGLRSRSFDLHKEGLMSTFHDLRRYAMPAVFALVASLSIAADALAAGKACEAGFANCDGKASNGCEINIGTSVDNCGACGNVCSAANGTPSCTNGSCQVASCNAGFANCDAAAANGCETRTGSDVNNCGACGVVCSTANGTASCTAGSCQLGTCNAGFADCNGLRNDGCETNLNSNGNCGACGRACAVGQSCSAGTCK